MNKGAALVGGVGLGAALMYFLDPDRGKRRRAMVRDKVEATGNKVGDFAEKMSRDIRERAEGVLAETKSLFAHEDVADEVLVDRVHAKLGRVPVQSAIDVQATAGVVILSGSVSAEELPNVLSAAEKVRGVNRVENQLRVVPTSGNAPDFQGMPLGAEA
ncbi:MAG TPA: BON domain-containing protein [Pyrinomonadaceae bacterium]|nr:BON domain-containing protein [Pyrinomonadaceae bacterium]